MGGWGSSGSHIATLATCPGVICGQLSSPHAVRADDDRPSTRTQAWWTDGCDGRTLAAGNVLERVLTGPLAPPWHRREFLIKLITVFF